MNFALAMNIHLRDVSPIDSRIFLDSICCFAVDGSIISSKSVSIVLGLGMIDMVDGV